MIYGLQGADNLYGGAGDDAFGYNNGNFAFGIWDRIKDFSVVAGNTDSITMFSFGAGNVLTAQQGSDVLISTKALGYSGGIIVENATLANVTAHLYLV